MPLFYETLFPAWFVFYILVMDVREGKLDGVKVKGWMIGLALVARQDLHVARLSSHPLFMHLLWPYGYRSTSRNVSQVF